MAGTSEQLLLARALDNSELIIRAEGGNIEARHGLTKHRVQPVAGILPALLELLRRLGLIPLCFQIRPVGFIKRKQQADDPKGNEQLPEELQPRKTFCRGVHVLDSIVPSLLIKEPPL